ncbi:MAG: LysM peptidoglycan-binding domain-containing protein [Sedimentisphaerales bacterium]
MRRDVKTGMLAGTVLCLIAIVWFCIKQQVITTPLIKFESQKLIAPANKEPAGLETSSPIVIAPADKQIQKSDSAAADKNTDTSIIHTVTQGQTLIDISKIYYNTSSGWKKIYEANKEQLPRGPDTIRTGMRLVIPP